MISLDMWEMGIIYSIINGVVILIYNIIIDHSLFVLYINDHILVANQIRFKSIHSNFFALIHQ